jgi:protoporphyrinogen oxidase
MGPRLARNQAIRKVVEETVRPPRPLRVAVLGGGITGLATAYRLAARKDTQVTLYEKSQQLGGWLQTEKVKVGGGNILFEWGPRTLRAIDALPTIELVRKALTLCNSIEYCPIIVTDR